MLRTLIPAPMIKTVRPASIMMKYQSPCHTKVGTERDRKYGTREHSSSRGACFDASQVSSTSSMICQVTNRSLHVMKNLHYAIFGDLILHPGMDHLGSFGPECLNGDILANAFTYAALARNLHMRVDRSIHATSLANGFLTLALQCVALIR